MDTGVSLPSHSGQTPHKANDGIMLWTQEQVLPNLNSGQTITTDTDVTKKTNLSGLLAKLIRLENGLGSITDQCAHVFPVFGPVLLKYCIETLLGRHALETLEKTCTLTHSSDCTCAADVFPSPLYRNNTRCVLKYSSPIWSCMIPMPTTRMFN